MEEERTRLLDGRETEEEERIATDYFKSLFE